MRKKFLIRGILLLLLSLTLLGPSITKAQSVDKKTLDAIDKKTTERKFYNEAQNWQKIEKENLAEDKKAPKSTTADFADDAALAATDSIVVLSAANKTCNVYAKNSTSSAVITYINPYSERDAALLATSGKWAKIKISGVIGWVTGACTDGKGYKAYDVKKLPDFKFDGLTGKDMTRYQVDGNKLKYYTTRADYNGLGITTYIGYTDVPKGLKNKTVYYSYDGIYYYTDPGQMIRDYKANTSSHAVNAKNPYFDYYTYLPMRSTSKIASSVYEAHLKSELPSAGNKYSETAQIGGCNTPVKNHKYSGTVSAYYKKLKGFTDQQPISKLNSSIIHAIAITESGNATSRLSYHYNNIFGWGAYDSNPSCAATYKSIGSGINTYNADMSEMYANPVSQLGGKGTQIGNKQSGANVKYASDPSWGAKNARNYRLLDERAGTKDKNQYKVGILSTGKFAGITGNEKDEWINVYEKASTSSAVKYIFERNYSSVIITGELGNFYKVLNSVGTKGGTIYVEKSKVFAIIGKGAGEEPTPPPTMATTNYEQDEDNKYYLWGSNSNGQLGTGNTEPVEQADRVDVETLITLDEGETIEQIVIWYNTNVAILTSKGQVWTSGGNTMGQRSTTSKPNVFTKYYRTWPISNVEIADFRVKMRYSVRDKAYFYVGKNNFNYQTGKFNENSDEIKYVVFRSGEHPQEALKYDTEHRRSSQKYYYEGDNDFLYAITDYKYFGDTATVAETIYNSTREKKDTYRLWTYYEEDGTTVRLVTEDIYFGGMLKKNPAGDPLRYRTTYKNGKPFESFKAYYDENGELGPETKVKLRQ